MKIQAPKVSIILPVFNAEKRLPRLLDSLLQQSFGSIEVIAIDDGSDDKSVEILKRYAKKDQRLYVIRQENSGVSSARNRGLSEARGRWIYFVDSDDFLYPDAIDTWYRYAEKNDVDFLIGNAYLGTEVNHALSISPANVLLKYQPWGVFLSGRDWIIYGVEHKEWPHYVWLQFIKRDLIINHGISFPAGILHEDIIWTIDLALHAKRIGFYDTPLYCYCRNQDSLTSNSLKNKINLRAKSYLVVLKHIKNRLETIEDRKLKQVLRKQLNRECGHFLGLIRKKIDDAELKKELAQDFFNKKLLPELFGGSGDFHGLWRAIRCLFVMWKSSLASSLKMKSK